MVNPLHPHYSTISLSAIDNNIKTAYIAFVGQDAQISQEKRVKIGSTVSILFDTGAVLSITIKTPREVDPKNGVVSYASPLGNALLEKEEGEGFRYAVGNRQFAGTVMKINE